MVNSGRPTGVACQKESCNGQIIYNGNYFCDICTWVMGQSRRDKELLIECLTGLRDKAVEAGDTMYAERCNYYLGLRDVLKGGDAR